MQILFFLLAMFTMPVKDSELRALRKRRRRKEAMNKIMVWRSLHLGSRIGSRPSKNKDRHSVDALSIDTVLGPIQQPGINSI